MRRSPRCLRTSEALAPGTVGPRRVSLALVLALGALGPLAACGAKTGLRIPDVGVDAADAGDVVDAFDVQDVQDVQDVIDVVDAYEACVPGRFELRPREAEVIFLIDRSNSMVLGIDGSPMPSPDQTRWAVLATALETALPPFQNTITMGATFFPGRVPPMSPPASQCRVDATLTVPPARANANAITRVLRETDPAGGTPTFAAIDVVRRYWAENPDRARARYMVLATDGGPNCNLALDYNTCVCTARDAVTGRPTCQELRSGYNCLDDQRTVRALADAAGSGFPTYVIGIDDPMRPDLTAVLDRMAIAGGRASSVGATRYYSVRRPADLANAFASIQRDIAQCAFVTPSRPDDPDAIAIEIDGVPIDRDRARTQGWDWTDISFGEITFFGEACDRAARSPSGVRARVGCMER